MEQCLNLMKQQSIFAKIITHADTREECIAKMKSALSECVIEGIKTIIPYQMAILNDDNFNYENIYLNDGIHLNRNSHANLFIKKILDELSKYLM